MTDQSTDRRRLHRAVEYKHPQPGVYSTADAMRAVRKVNGKRWETGVRQPYNTGDDYDFSKPNRYRRLRDAQDDVERQESERPRSVTMTTPFNDRRKKK